EAPRDCSSRRRRDRARRGGHQRERARIGRGAQRERVVMTPSNRRVGRPKLPPQGMGEGRVRAKEPPVSEEPDPRPAEATPLRAKGRFGVFARGLLGVVLVISVSATVAWAARRYVMTTPRFAVKDIAIAGAHRRTSDEIA